MTLGELLPFLVPLIVLELALMLIGIYDLTRPERRVKGESKMIWALVIVFVGIFGPLIYFFAGREES